MGASGKKYTGRGVRLIISISPQITESEMAYFQVLKQSILDKYFKNCNITLYDTKGNISRIKVYCPEAIFQIKLSEADKFYTSLFYDIFGQIGTLCMRILHKAFEIDEYSFLYRFSPKENPDEVVPFIALHTVGAFLLWRRLYSKSLKEDITQNIANKTDKKRLKEITSEIADARPLVAKNEDFIFEMAQKLGIWKPYRTIDDVKRAHVIPLDVMAKSLKTTSGVGQAHFMPMDNTELKLIKRYLDALD